MSILHSLHEFRICSFPHKISSVKYGGREKSTSTNMGNSSTKPHFETAKKTGTLSLVKSDLNEFSNKLIEIAPELRQLNICQNKFTVLPTQIEKFVKLKSLKMDNNKIKYLPVEIGKLVKLEILSAASNQIASIPDTVSLLQNLKNINLSSNHLSEFPAQLCELKHLSIIDMSNNRIKEIPDCIGNTNATELNLNENQIAVISPKISDAGKLIILKLQSNQLTISAIPKQLLTDSKVSYLLLENNLFNTKDLEYVDGYDTYMERYTETKKKLF